MKKSLLTLGLLGLGLGAFAQNPFPLVGPFVEVNRTNIQTPPSLGIGQISTISPTFCWALGYDSTPTPAGPKNQLLTPSNAAGTEFNYLSVAGSAGFQPSNISAVTTTLAYCAQYSGSMNGGGGEVIRTTNGGNTWRRISTTANFANPAGFANWVSMFDANVGVAMGDPNPLPAGGGPGVFEIIRTTNASASAAAPVGGVTVPTWTRITAVPTALTADEYGIVESYTSLGNSVWCGTSHVNAAGVDQPCRVLRSTDRGLTWTAANTPLLGAISKLAFKDQNNGIAYRQNTTSADLIRTTDGGVTWTIVPLPTGRDTLCGKFYRYDIQAIPGQGFISMGQAIAGERRPFNFGVSYSIDGIRWTDLEKGVRSYIAGGLINCTITPAGATFQGYLGGFTGRAGSDPGIPGGGQGGMYQVSPTTCGVFRACTVVSTRSAELQRSLSVYPNPSSNGVFQVSLNDGIKAGTVLTVFDVMGRVVMARELNATAVGSKTVNLDLSNEKSGVYTLRISGDNGFATSKLVVE